MNKINKFPNGKNMRRREVGSIYILIATQA
jgi:hypothetical protein